MALVPIEVVCETKEAARQEARRIEANYPPMGYGTSLQIVHRKEDDKWIVRGLEAEFLRLML